ncbi:FAM210 family protein [Myxococcus landrumensis]|uniref:FAM210 family protein n=1 Tax=Myxococcus landrumensis TaxID=2813577 RepID=UPI001F505AED|nr:FAM210 family protein [Myxococcus landrumus]
MNPPVSDTSPPTPTQAARPEKPSLMARFKNLMLEYGPVAIATNFALFGVVLAGFYVAIELGFQPASAGAKAGTFAAAYAATQVVKPLRLAAVFVLTPLIARIPPVARFLERNKHKWSL